MSRIVMTNYLTLEGVMQSPRHPDEDRREREFLRRSRRALAAGA